MTWLLQSRAELVPYLYTATRQAFDTGISLVRPMYYDNPDENMAYAATPSGDFPQVRSLALGLDVQRRLCCGLLGNRFIWILRLC